MFHHLCARRRHVRRLNVHNESTLTTENHCHCCAERRLVKKLLHKSIQKGIPLNKFSQWVHRIHGTLIVYRQLGDGSNNMGISIPCILCRKVIEKYHIKWAAFDGKRWIHSWDENLPQSKPTHKQRMIFKLSS